MENKQFIEAVSNILQCSCAERGYLLAMLCTVILKILERYRAAAQMNTVTGQSIPYRIAASHRSRQPSSPASSRDTSRTQQIASQLVLGELHRLQVLLARLSLRIDWDEREPGMGTGSEYCSEPANDWQGRTNHEDFSAAALRQMQTDLQNCLSRLSSDLIGILRHA
ncbi:aflatoxin regulatory protein-domain-containing protein [Penicillium nucicola]|uniref:aflatoxin regulatory protein-domain-containing protein n=1 Tax=Penicillium nucicola TaxID=1850975 RepID=UPI0025456144|nr:aflatoxin regulatory protein-domain-containing protein [Penicillium nucicola]KAJ5762086.1 aflatoxin regulatory protein-domain-containing protein [Penicillium nucicola]